MVVFSYNETSLGGFGLDMFNTLKNSISFYFNDPVNPEHQLQLINECFEHHSLNPMKSLEEVRNFLYPHLVKYNIEVDYLLWQEFDQEILDAINCKEDDLKSLIQEDKEEHDSGDNKLSW